MFGLNMSKHICPRVMGERMAEATRRTLFARHYVLLQVFRRLHNSQNRKSENESSRHIYSENINLDIFSVCSLMHVEGIEGSKHCGTLSACVRESIWKMFALNVVAHIAHRVVGELFTDGARRFPSCSVSCHINIEVLRLCKFTLNKKPGINSCHIFSCGKFL